MLRRDPMLLPGIAFALGVGVSTWLNLPWWQAGMACGVWLAAVVWSRWRRWYALGLFVFVGIVAEMAWRPGARPELDAAPFETVTLSGCVVEPPAFSEGREQFVVELEPGARARVTKYLREEEAPPALRYGQRVEFAGRARVPRNYGNPGAFDIEGYLARRAVYWTVSISAGAPVTVMEGRCGNRVAGAIFDLRGLALDRIAALYAGNSYAIGMLQAMLIGDMARLERVWADDFRRTGTYHAIVISGLHITMIVWVLLKLLRMLALHRSWVSHLVVPVIWVYAGMCGWQTPVVRAAAGFTLFAVSRYFFRESRILNVLGVLAVAFLALDPGQLSEASFHLTFLAVLALGALAIPAAEATTSPLLDGLRDLGEASKDMHLAPRVAQFRIELRLVAETLRQARVPAWAALWMPRLVALALFWIWETLLISAAVQLGLALPMVLYFHRLSFTGLTANLIVTPLLTMAVPLGLLAILTGWTLPVQATGGLVEAARWVANWHALREPNWRVPDPPLWLAAAFVSVLILLAATRRKWLLAPAVALLAVIGWHPFDAERAAGQLELTMIDVGQGDALLAGLPDGRWLLVDGGGIPVFGRRAVKPRLDLGEDVVTPYLLGRGIRRVDVIACTHLHDDHAAGLPALMENFRPAELWTGATPDSPLERVLRNKASALGIRLRRLRHPEVVTLGAVRIDVLAPPADYVPKTAPSNNDSLVLRLGFGGHRFLLTGDMERAIERGLVEEVGVAQVLKVPHHGSKTSSSAALLDAVKPAFALVSAGKDNQFRHPHPEVVARLEERHAMVLRTDEQGLITVRSDGKRLTVRTHRWERQGWRPSQPF